MCGHQLSAAPIFHSLAPAIFTAILLASSFVSSLAADRSGVHELIADVSFQPQQPLCGKVEEDSDILPNSHLGFLLPVDNS
jgi:hypothetical protein